MQIDDATTELARLVGFEGADGALVAGAANVGFPADYLELVRLFGAGSFNDFLWLLVPDCPNEHLDVNRQTAQQLDVLRVCAREGDDVSADLLTQPASALPWAITDNGDVAWWRRRGEDPNDGTVLVSSARPLEWEEYDMSCSRFLVRFVTDSLASELIPEGEEQASFRSWRA